MKLTKLNNEVSWEELKEDEYALLTSHGENTLCGIVYKCPQCSKVVFITNLPDKPRWDINFETLTATPSIVHDVNKGGCGWHGYLTNDELKC